MSLKINWNIPIDNQVLLFDNQQLIIQLVHSKSEPEAINRIHISGYGSMLELYPSKGLSIGQLRVHDKPIFWDSPSPLVDVSQLDLQQFEIGINGSMQSGFAYIPLYNAGIELLGLQNWGMPKTNPATGDLQILHGEVHSIPVYDVSAQVSGSEVTITGTYLYRTFSGDQLLPWFERGNPLFEITRVIHLNLLTGHLLHTDTIKNISTTALKPDWGYHVTFFPIPGAKCMVPSLIAFDRFKASLNDDIETWYPAQDDGIRCETGIIHQHLLADKQDEKQHLRTTSLIQYPDNTGIAVSVPVAPYFQTWFCNGGKNSTEFTYRDGRPVLTKNWDGLGLEFGSSALDHNGVADSLLADSSPLLPDQQLHIAIEISVVKGDKLDELREKIGDYNRARQIN